MNPIALGSDHVGYRLKEIIKKHLKSLEQKYQDFGVYSEESVDYPDIGLKVAESIASGEFSRGILICGTGIGMAIVANKVPHVRAALCHDTYSAERARRSNNAQILTMGAQVMGPEPAKKIVETWLASDFGQGPSARVQASARKVNKINRIDEKYRRLG
jgi:ribose 5-phosphate isomerase B